jgi:hypothetical protein
VHFNLSVISLGLLVYQEVDFSNILGGSGAKLHGLGGWNVHATECRNQIPPRQPGGLTEKRPYCPARSLRIRANAK